jgi:hypothetical protein
LSTVPSLPDAQTERPSGAALTARKEAVVPGSTRTTPPTTSTSANTNFESFSIRLLDEREPADAVGAELAVRGLASAAFQRNRNSNRSDVNA